MLALKKMIVAIAGPITNLIIIIICGNIKINMFLYLIIIYANILLIIFNLLPIYPLDGGRFLKEILHIFFGKNKAEKYINIISFITLIIVTIISSISIYYIKNIAVFIAILFLWGIYIKEDIIYKKKLKIYNLIIKTIEIEENK